MSKEVLLQPLVVARSDQERCLIEGSINSVRISIGIKQSDEMERVLVDRFSRFLAQRADDFVILRRAAVKVREYLAPRCCSRGACLSAGLCCLVPDHQLPHGGHEEGQAG